MKYSRFETLVLAVGIAAVIGSMFFSIGAAPIVEEMVAQLLLLGVLIGAVHWGRKGGFIAAAIASVIYILMRAPLLIEEGLTPDVAALILVRILTYGLVGIVGGELCGRIKYVFAKMEDSNSVYEWSQVYNQRFIARALEASVGQFRRYETDFSIILLAVSDTLLDDLRPSKQRSMVRGIASYIRNDIRLVDELGRLEDGTFIAVLPHTPAEGAVVVAERLHKGVCDALGAKTESISANVLSTPNDAAEIDSLHEKLAAILLV
ncbi:MAG: hypothetical protein E4H28_07105, partial [Gemmatimonadales bacterium]